MATDQYPTQQRLKELFDYHPETGVFIRKVTINNKALAGTVAGCDDHRGYLLIQVDGTLYKAHRLAWLYVYGVPPTHAIDHINGHKSQNWIANLREATKGQNMSNTTTRCDNTSGYKGVTWNRDRQKWQAQINHEGQHYYLGLFVDANDASAAYDKAAIKLHGRFARTNSHIVNMKSPLSSLRKV